MRLPSSSTSYIGALLIVCVYAYTIAHIHTVVNLFFCCYSNSHVGASSDMSTTTTVSMTGYCAINSDASEKLLKKYVFWRSKSTTAYMLSPHMLLRYIDSIAPKCYAVKCFF